MKAGLFVVTCCKMPLLCLRRILHFFLVAIVAPIPWFIGFSCLAIALFAVLWADKLWPNATMGNCWSFVGPRWWKYGGYFGVRNSEGVKMFHKGPIPHALWIRRLFPTPIIEQSSPVNRKEGRWLLFRGGLYFHFRQTDQEGLHHAATETLPPEDDRRAPKVENNQ